MSTEREYSSHGLGVMGRGMGVWGYGGMGVWGYGGVGIRGKGVGGGRLKTWIVS